MEASLKSLSDVVAVKPNDIELSGNGLQSNKKDVLFQLRTYKESIYIDKGVGDATCSVKFIEGKATLEISFPLGTPLQNVSVQDTRKISTLVQDGIEGFFDNLDTAVCFAGLPSIEPLSQIRKKTTFLKPDNNSETANVLQNIPNDNQLQRCHKDPVIPDDDRGKFQLDTPKLQESTPRTKKQKYNHQCNKCKKWFRSPSNLIDHFVDHYREDHNIHTLVQCTGCEKPFTDRKNWLKHKNTVNNRRCVMFRKAIVRIQDD
jgi:hypothetical protein